MLMVVLPIWAAWVATNPFYRKIFPYLNRSPLCLHDGDFCFQDYRMVADLIEGKS
jgi:hypothetical protein